MRTTGRRTDTSPGRSNYHWPRALLPKLSVTDQEAQWDVVGGPFLVERCEAPTETIK